MWKGCSAPGILPFAMALGVFVGAVQASETSQEVVIEAKEFAFSPKRITVDQPGKITFVVRNTGEFPHGFKIWGVTGGLALIEVGETDEASFVLEKGTYTIYCPLRGHRKRGMVGTLGVGREPSQKARDLAPSLPSSPY